MRRIISFLIIIFILLWSYNLFVDKIMFKEDKRDEPYKGIIKFIDIQDNIIKGENYKNWMESRIRRFERQHPGLYIEFEYLEDLDFDKGDIIPVDIDFDNYDILIPLEEVFTNDEIRDFNYQIYNSLYFKDKLYSLPIGVSTNTMYINVDLFNERGVSYPYDGSWTYEEFYEIVKDLNYDSDDDGIIDIYGFLTSFDTQNTNLWGLILSDGAELINNKRRTYSFQGEKAISGLEKIIRIEDLYKNGEYGLSNVSQEKAWQLFANEKRVGIFAASSSYAKILDNRHKSGDGFSFETLNYPSGDKGIPNILSHDIISYGIVKDEDRAKVNMSIKFLEFLTSDSNQRSLEEINLFSVKRNIDDMYMEDYLYKSIEESLKNTIYLPRIENWAMINDIIHKELKDSFNNKESYEAIEEAWDKIKNIQGD